MTIEEAQADLRRAYVGGGPGAMVSALVWLAAAAVLAARGVPAAFATLFFGGMLIFPLGLVLCRQVLRVAGETKGNPLGRSALESTIAMIAGLCAAWLFTPYRPDLVFPLSALAVGTHYFVFRTSYGDPLFWVLGALIAAVGAAGVFVPGLPTLALVLTVAAIELVLGVMLTARALSQARANTPASRGRPVSSSTS